MEHSRAMNQITSKFNWIFNEYKGLPDVGYYIGSKWSWAGPLKMHYTYPYSGEISHVYSITHVKQVVKAIKDQSVTPTPVASRLVDRLSLLKALAVGIEKYSKELSMAISIISGKPLREAEFEVDMSVELLENSYIMLETYGNPKRMTNNMIVSSGPSNGASIIMPSYTSPILTSVFGVIHAIAIGSSLLILKPPSKAPLPVVLLASILVENEIKNIIVTPPISGPVILDVLINNVLVSHIFASGSTKTIESISRRSPGLHKVLWASDLSAAVVCDESVVEKAARVILESRLAGCGDLCLNTHVVFVPEQILESMEDKLALLASNERPGDPLDYETTIGPLLDDERSSFMESLIDDAVSRGARLLWGMRLKPSLYHPFVLGNVKKASKIIWQRTIVPLIGVVPVKTCMEGVLIADSLPYTRALLFYDDNPYNYLDKLRMLKINLIYVNKFKMDRTDFYDECANIYTSPLIDSTWSRRIFKSIILGEEEYEPETYR